MSRSLSDYVSHQVFLVLQNPQMLLIQGHQSKQKLLSPMTLFCLQPADLQASRDNKSLLSLSIIRLSADRKSSFLSLSAPAPTPTISPGCFRFPSWSSQILRISQIFLPRFYTRPALQNSIQWYGVLGQHYVQHNT